MSPEDIYAALVEFSSDGDRLSLAVTAIEGATSQDGFQHAIERLKGELPINTDPRPPMEPDPIASSMARIQAVAAALWKAMMQPVFPWNPGA